MFGKKYFVVAVSGGVDSVVLLHMIAGRKALDTIYIVAHFDHGMRDDSHKDAELVRGLAGKYGMEFELGAGSLGKGASEAVARVARYEFLRAVAQKYGAQKIITAHHQDDVLETMVLNMLRGTGPRGLRPMHGQEDILRPLLGKTKKYLTEYAAKHKLMWREDSTNDDEAYLRNYVRKHVMPRLEPAREELVKRRHAMEELLHELDLRIALYLPKTNVLRRSGFVTLSWAVRRELMRAWLVRCGVDNIDRKLVERLCVAAATLPPGKKTAITKDLWLISQQKNVLITSQ